MSDETLQIMDDQRTRETLDALAELFLTGPAAPSNPPAQPPGAHPLATGTDTPQPMRLPPKLRPAQATRPAMSMDLPPNKPGNPASQTIGNPPSLRLTNSEAPRATHATPASGRNGGRSHAAVPSVSREAVFLSNVPGFSGPWLTQYAHQVARQRGPVGIIHMDDHAIDIDVVTVFNPPLPQDIDDSKLTPDEMMQAVVRVLSERDDEPDVLAVMHRLTTLPHHAVRHWLVHLSTPPTAIDISRAWHFDRWTILTGADETAVAAAAVLLERLTAEEHNAVDPDRLETLQIAVAVVGSDPGLAGDVATRISDLAEFIPQGVLPTLAQKQMVPVAREVVGAFADPLTQWPRISAYLSGTFDVATLDDPILTVALPTVSQLAAANAMGEYDDGDDDDAPTPVTDEALARGLAMKAALLEEPADDEAATPPRVEPERSAPAPKAAPIDSRPAEAPAPPARSSTMLTGSASASTPAAAKAAPAPPISDAAAASDDELDLASFLPADVRQGLVVLQARCPKHARTQLVLDDQGTVHLLRHHAAAQGDDLRAAVVDLIEARLWVREHLELLKLTQRQCTFNAAAEPLLHLFTDQTKLATGLANKVGHLVTLHLLQQVHVGEQFAWFSAAMN